ncbi:hypothetical protein NC653_028787 [Populus alba x Populus x berolinensis]|uniref:Uncharacterized protein n=1 Tax=Populus alba x Populus x berolinensis TaxID=444605 RepID=A0AAD6M0K9_9ROSI|nr:hypothetical protein NC653_028787 [Populus alba x Populus x berolinensis]
MKDEQFANGNPRVDLGRDQESRSHERGWLVKNLIINNPNASAHFINSSRTFWANPTLGGLEDALCFEDLLGDDMTGLQKYLMVSTDRSDIAWKDAKYAQIWEYLRDEFELTRRFASLNLKLKFVEVIDCNSYMNTRCDAAD